MKHRRVRAGDGVPYEDEQAILDAIAPYAAKWLWFKERGYEPHLFQLSFHVSSYEDRLRRFRMLVAGRRGGKTLSAAWETVYYAANPREFHWDAHRREDDAPLHIWVLTPDYRSSGRAALYAIRKCLKESGLEEGKDYKENRGDLYIEFTNGSLIEFKTAERPDKLVGAGLDILWIDEAALIASEEAWNIARPALSDKLGIVIGTTTPRGKNWFYHMFWAPEALEDPTISSVEYRSIDNPHFSSEEWQTVKRSYHPLMFKQEFMASFDSMAGKELAGDWLHYFTFETESGDPDVITIPRKKDNPKLYALRTYIGIDPAVSLADTADRFAMALVGVTEDNSQAFLLRQWAGRIPFHEQLDKISEWFHTYRPMLIGIESQAYQRVLADQAMRLEGFPGVVPIFAQGKKWERILSMAPLFKIAKVRIHKSQKDFIEEWLDYDSELRNPNDDCLDAVEIALRTAGALLPQMVHEDAFDRKGPRNFDEWAWEQLRSPSEGKYDPDMGIDF